MTFDDAFLFAMRWEVSSTFNPKDPEVIAGLCGTPAQRKKVGYVNDAFDSGGLTKFGVAQNSHKSIDVQNLTLAQAKEIYKAEYWNRLSCDKLPSKVALVLFDTSVNAGTKKGTLLLQMAAQVQADGILGPATIAKCNLLGDELATKLIIRRRQFYLDIVQNKPMQVRFLQGWLNRCSDLELKLKK